MPCLDKFPGFEQFVLMQIEPLQHMPERPFREIAPNDPATNIHRDLIFTVYRVKMRRRMVARKDADSDSEKS